MSNNKYELPEEIGHFFFNEESDYPGVEFDAHIDIPIGELFKYQTTDWDTEAESMLKQWGDQVLVSWNLTKNGAAIPADGVGIFRPGIRMIRDMMKAWSDGVVDPPPPLLPPSTDGGMPPEDSGQTESSSPDPQASSKPRQSRVSV